MITSRGIHGAAWPITQEKNVSCRAVAGPEVGGPGALPAVGGAARSDAARATAASRVDYPAHRGVDRVGVQNCPAYACSLNASFQLDHARRSDNPCFKCLYAIARLADIDAFADQLTVFEGIPNARVNLVYGRLPRARSKSRVTCDRFVYFLLVGETQSAYLAFSVTSLPKLNELCLRHHFGLSFGRTTSCRPIGIFRHPW